MSLKREEHNFRVMRVWVKWGQQHFLNSQDSVGNIKKATVRGAAVTGSAQIVGFLFILVAPWFWLDYLRLRITDRSLW